MAKLSKQVDSKTPLWIMRQAGRYLPEYREVRSKFESFVEFCLTPDAACEVTIQPLKRFDLDAAIIFSDILIVPKALGIDVRFEKGEGPKLDTVRNARDLAKLHSLDTNVVNKVCEAIKKVKQRLNVEFPNKALIGFAGAPFTVCSYMIEGGGSKDFAHTKELMASDPETFNTLINTVTEATIEYLDAQVKAGADAVKIFDSWAQVMPFAHFDKYIYQPIERIAEEVKRRNPGIKVIGFPKGVGERVTKFYDSNLDAIAIDQQANMKWVIDSLPNKVIQGNFDNYNLCYGTRETIEQEARSIMHVAGRNHLIFNLGHGILPETPIDNVHHLIDFVIANR